MKKFRFNAEDIPYKKQDEVIDNVEKMIEYINLGLRQNLGEGDLKVFSTTLLLYLKFEKTIIESH